MAETDKKSTTQPDNISVDAIRRKNLRAIAEEMGGQKWLAEKLERSASQISQLIGRRSHDYVKSRTIGNKLAREFERKLNKDPGWLDRKHDASKSFQIPIISLDSYNGQAFDPENWPQSNIYITSQTRSLLENHDGDIILLATDNGMSPEINANDILLCKHVSSFAGDGIYVLSQVGHKYVRHVNLSTCDEGEPLFIITGVSSHIEKIITSELNFIAKVKEVWNRVRC